MCKIQQSILYLTFLLLKIINIFVAIVFAIFINTISISDKTLSHANTEVSTIHFTYLLFSQIHVLGFQRYCFCTDDNFYFHIDMFYYSICNWNYIFCYWISIYTWTMFFHCFSFIFFGYYMKCFNTYDFCFFSTQIFLEISHYNIHYIQILPKKELKSFVVRLFSFLELLNILFYLR